MREFYIWGENAVLYDIDKKLIAKSVELFTLDGFDTLHGADLVFACIAYIEDAYLVTMDRKLAMHASKQIKVINLSDSIWSPKYRDLFR